MVPWNDVMIGGSVENVCHGLQSVVPTLARIDLEVNLYKWEVMNVNNSTGDFVTSILDVSSLLPKVWATAKEAVLMVGLPTLLPVICSILRSKLLQLEPLMVRLKVVNSHQTLFLLRNCFTVPKLLYTLHRASCSNHVPLLMDFDASSQQAAKKRCNVKFNGTGWQQNTFMAALAFYLWSHWTWQLFSSQWPHAMFLSMRFFTTQPNHLWLGNVRWFIQYGTSLPCVPPMSILLPLQPSQKKRNTIQCSMTTVELLH